MTAGASFCLIGSKEKESFLRWTGLSPRRFSGMAAALLLRVVVSPVGDEYIVKTIQPPWRAMEMHPFWC